MRLTGGPEIWKNIDQRADVWVRWSGGWAGDQRSHPDHTRRQSGIVGKRTKAVKHPDILTDTGHVESGRLHGVVPAHAGRADALIGSRQASSSHRMSGQTKINRHRPAVKRTGIKSRESGRRRIWRGVPH